MKLDPTRIPEGCSHLVPLAERWGLGDDFEREEKLASAERADLQELVKAIQDLPGDTLFDWLAGPESRSVTPTPEYVAFTCLTMAYDSARSKLKRPMDTEPWARGYK